MKESAYRIVNNYVNGLGIEGLQSGLNEVLAECLRFLINGNGHLQTAVRSIELTGNFEVVWCPYSLDPYSFNFLNGLRRRGAASPIVDHDLPLFFKVNICFDGPISSGTHIGTMFSKRVCSSSSDTIGLSCTSNDSQLASEILFLGHCL